MTVEEDGLPCSETTEPSNVTSLATDAYSTVNSSESPDVATKQRTDTNNERRYEADKKLAASPAARGGPVTNYGQVTPANHQPQRALHHLPAQFEPAAQCLCHTYRVKQFALPEKYLHPNSERLNGKWPKREYARRKEKLYEVKLKKNHYRHYSKGLKILNFSRTRRKPRRRVYRESRIRKWRKPRRRRKSSRKRAANSRRYRRGLTFITSTTETRRWYRLMRYYRTTDSPPILATERCADKTDYAATRFWAEIFGTVHIGVAFVVAFILQFLRFLLYSIVRPLTVGTLQLLADYFVKPLLSITFNALVQPVLILLYNVATSLRDLCEPIAEAIGFFLRELAGLVRAFRLIDINRVEHRPTGCT